MTRGTKTALVLGLLYLVSRTSSASTKRLTLAQLRVLAKSVGFPDPDLAAAVAMAESGGRPDIVVPEPTGSPSYGLWQIHASAHPQYSTMLLLDPTYNARAAFAISNRGTKWSDWSTYNHGLHTKYLPKGTS